MSLPADTALASAPAAEVDATDGDGSHYEEAAYDDDDSEPEVAPAAAARGPHPLDGWSNERLLEAARLHPSDLGSISLGTPNAGQLLNGVRLPADEGWKAVDPSHAWGTAETVTYLATAIHAVEAAVPDTPPLSIGHLSAQRGGHLSPHVSHQSGRDVDLSFYYAAGGRWYARGTATNLDLERNWQLVRALVVQTDVEFILCDASILRLLREHALAKGEDRDWVHRLFDGQAGIERPLLRHARGHGTHFHVRFYNPIAQESARRAHGALVAAGLVEPRTSYQTYVAKKGDTLGKIAKRFHTTVRAIQQANALRNTKIVAKLSYRIPVAAGTATPPAVRVPPRRLPPVAAPAPMKPAPARGELRSGTGRSMADAG